ncbi:MAG: DNA phosphorothioation-dependent restriction protein DptG [Sarcina sp.]
MTLGEKYELNMVGIRENLTKNHIQCSKYKLFPFIANDSKLVDDFNGVNGAFSRIVSNKAPLKSDSIEIDAVIEKIQSSIAKTENEKYAIKSMIESMFLNDERKLINFDVRVLNYLESTSFEEKIAGFLSSILLDYSLQETILRIYGQNVDNIMHKLILEYLPELKEVKKISHAGWSSNFNVAKKYFNEDLEFLIKNEELYNQNIKRVLEYYYLFYVSQASFKLNEFEKANLDEVKEVYFTLNTEKSVGKNRKTYNLGLKMLEKSMGRTFTHAITLEFLNMSNFEEKINYVDLADSLDSENIISFKNGMRELIDGYKKRWSEDTNWENLKNSKLTSEVDGYELVYKLFEAVDHQFTVKGSKRAKAYKSYSNWIVKFMQNKFGKTRGATGYVLSLSEDDIILFTKIIMKDLEKMKLKAIFEEFEFRGIFFDRDSKAKVLQLYEKLNIIEKKSDSGDAIYVKTIL